MKFKARLRVLIGCGLISIAAVTSGCSAGQDPLAEQLEAVGADAGGTVSSPSSSTTEPVVSSSGQQGLRVTLVSIDESAAADAGAGENATTTVSTASTTSTTATTQTTTASTTTSVTTASSTTAPTSASTSSTATTSGPSTSSTAPGSSSTTAQSPGENDFPADTVLNFADGQTVSFADQVAGSRPVLVWFWLPG